MKAKVTAARAAAADRAFALLMSLNDAVALHTWAGYKNRADYEERGVKQKINFRIIKTEYYFIERDHIKHTV